MYFFPRTWYFCPKTSADGLFVILLFALLFFSDRKSRRTPNANECCFATHSSLELLCCTLQADGKVDRKGLTNGTKIIADPEKCFQELISEKNYCFFLRNGPCLELIIVSSHFQALLLLQDKLLESV